MPYEYIEHEADVGILAIGNSVEEAFCEGAKATFNVMVDLKGVEPKKEVKVRCKSDKLSTLFIEWLNELISLADMDDLFFSEFRVKR